jgi:2-C-methyl-D-erythritol 4-phosphate cytidylyltransferase
MQVVAIIVAAGASTRFGSKTKKQFFTLAGKPVLVYCLEVFNRSPLINRIVLVVPPGLENTVRKSIVQKYRLHKVTDIVPGGKVRTDSVWNGLQSLPIPDFGFRKSDLVLIHDGVRPFITETMILDTVRAVKKTGAATIATKITDTVKSAGHNLIINKTIPRDKLWCVQTPQGFKVSLLLNAYARAKKMNYITTDDAGVMEQLGIPVKLVPGPITNIKITTKHDINIAETILKYHRF